MAEIKNLEIDIESFSDVDLTKCGVYKYASASDFEVILFAYSVDGGPVRQVDLACGEKIPAEIIAALEDDTVTKWAFNANFERVCLSRYLGYPTGDYLMPDSWCCSMVWAAYLGLPLSLEGVGTVLGLEKQKLTEGKNLIKYFCQPCAPTKSNGGRTRNLPADAPENLHNLMLILENDENLKGIVFNQLADGMEIRGKVPWPHPAKFWRDADDAQLICYVDAAYGTFSARNYDIAVTKAVDDRSYHPIREFFETLPAWDGMERADTLLIDYLGAEDTPYVRAVTRKELCAAYCRVYHPGIKFDSMIVLNGDQGIGKSTLIAKLGGEWYSDSLNLSDMNDKTAAEKLQGYWIMEIGELAGMRKADLDKVKAFISRQDDKYRASFGRRVTPHPRQCVFFGTTNSQNGYLRDITGNRRYWNVKVPGNGKYKPWDMDADTVKQVWAEVMVYAKAGEKLYLPPELEAYAKEEQRAAMERDDREGLVQEYLDMLLPDTWDSMDVYKRRDYVRDADDPMRPDGSVRRMEVSNMEIWCECFGKAKEDMKPSDSYSIAAIMERMDGWSRTGKAKVLPIYGKQRIYRRNG